MTPNAPARTPERPTIFVVDDDPDLRLFARTCLDDGQHTIEEFGSGEEALDALSRLMPTVVLLDLEMPGMGGMETLERIKERQRHLPVIVLTGQRGVGTVVDTIRRGAYDFLPKPIEPDKLITSVQNAIERYGMAVRLALLERQVEGGGIPGIIGSAPIMRDLFEQIERVSSADISVYVRGESGTGKELVSKAIHDLSGRAKGPFVALNCAGVAESLQESELFGYERGAFTGADRRHTGKFEQADGGTLFLDEVAELSLRLQSKLLRVLQERKVQPLGSTKEVPVDFRLLAATHRDLAEEVRAGRFREDLYYRIVVFEVEVPPLRDRTGDVLELSTYFLEHFGPSLVNAVPTLSPEATATLTHYSWPGNVRELQNAIQRAIVASGGAPISRSDLPPSIRNATAALFEGRGATPTPPAPYGTRPEAGASGNVIEGPFGRAGASRGPAGGYSAPPAQDGAGFVVTPDMSMDLVERLTIEQALDHHNGNIAQVANHLGIGRTTLYRRLRRYDIK